MESVPPAALGAAVPSTAAVAQPSMTPTVPAPSPAKVDHAPDAHDSDGDEASDESDVYEVAHILDSRRTEAGTTEYLIKWKGWGAQHNSWEPREHIMDEEMLAEFNAKQPKPRSPKPATPRGREGGAADGADLRDAQLLASLRCEWLAKFKQKDLAIAAGIGVNKISLYLNNKLESATSRTNVETKLREFFAAMRATGGGASSPTGPLVERAKAAPKPRAAGGGGGSGGNGAASDGGAGVGAAAAEAAVSKADDDADEDDEEEAWLREDDEEESEGEGVNRIESLLCERTFQPGKVKHWLVKWHDFPYSEKCACGPCRARLAHA